MPFTAIQDQRMPHIVLADNSAALPWHYGPHFSSRLATGYTRLTKLGLLFGNIDGSTRLPSRLHAWASESCVPSSQALCEQLDSSGKSVMLSFPQGQVDIPQSFENVHANSFTEKFPNGWWCPRASACAGPCGRTQSPPQNPASRTARPRSACRGPRKRARCWSWCTTSRWETSS